MIAGKLSGKHEIEIWGDGEQTRSFMYIDDCVDGTHRLMDSDIVEPINLGSDELVTINQLVDIVEEIAGDQAEARATTSTRPRACDGRNSDNTLIKKLGLGTLDPSRGRHGEDLPVDLRRDDGHWITILLPNAELKRRVAVHMVARAVAPLSLIRARLCRCSLAADNKLRPAWVMEGQVLDQKQVGMRRGEQGIASDDRFEPRRRKV